MSSTYYTSLTGMMAASYGLQNASNNITNMKSPGFKRTDVFYSSLGNSTGQGSLGSGVYVGGQATNFSQGNYQDTGSPSDLAIVGNGFFIVQLQNGELLYTRDGEFGFNNDGFLIDNHSKGMVQGYDQHGNLVPISQFGPKTYPGKATHSVDLKGEFIISKLKELNENNSMFDSNKFNISIYDEKGIAHIVALEFSASHTPLPADNPNPPDYHDELQWTLTGAKCSTADVFGDSQTIQFSDTGSGTYDGVNTIRLILNNTQEITLNFGDQYTSESSGVLLRTKEENSHPQTKIEVLKQDGYHFGKQIEFAFDDNGQISYKYDNGKSQAGNHIALALFDELEHTLVQAQDNLFRAKNTNGLRIGKPNKENFGTIQPKKLEGSNVDPTTEFANIVVLQRMFQSCSQIMDIDKQLLEELYKK